MIVSVRSIFWRWRESNPRARRIRLCVYARSRLRAPVAPMRLGE